MGFGTLFFGYFLLLNITYYSFTDLIAALIMAMGLYKLSSVNRPFRNGLIAAFVFAGLGLVELVCGTLDMFLSVTLPSELLSVTSVSRYFVIAVLTLFIFKGIDEVAREVGLSELSRRARISMPIALFIYTASAVLDIPILESGVNVRFFAISSAIILILTLVIVTVNLVTIYTAYMKICMPEDVDNDYEEKPSRFEFINKHREHTLQKQREYAEYKLSRKQKRSSHKKKK